MGRIGRRDWEEGASVATETTRHGAYAAPDFAPKNSRQIFWRQNLRTYSRPTIPLAWRGSAKAYKGTRVTD